MNSSKLLQLAIPLVKSHGFTREALARSVLHLPKPHPEPLPDISVTALFGRGDDARRALVNAWLEDARCRMKDNASASASMRRVLHARMKTNEPVLGHLPEAFALVATSPGVLLVDPLPILRHAALVADQACWIVQPQAQEMTWYTRRASLSVIYLAAELHQLTSPNTAESFLDYLLENSDAAEKAIQEITLFSSYILRSWKGLAKSAGVL
ncbi:hypothetical protein PAXRUDRAFT_491106 [Paxillus rubicundulus Ve08.2h10]|uniref:COQ9 C-terminal domain-containing protein n=1 Tax=Paxillus rubicundulus Ve08.2h10 TaxID=930991 RepID=A0A0D0DLS0_9AGAM|nr:hypothetical protein PAXRUDRAFT_491106 [Paxillus rubicundulus Ve08.2h10]